MFSLNGILKAAFPKAAERREARAQEAALQGRIMVGNALLDLALVKLGQGPNPPADDLRDMLGALLVQDIMAGRHAQTGLGVEAQLMGVEARVAEIMSQQKERLAVRWGITDEPEGDPPIVA